MNLKLNFYTNKAIILFFIVLFFVSMYFSNRTMPFHWIMSGIVEFVLFFAFLAYLIKKWALLPEHIFLRKVFITAFVIRLIYVLFSYVMYTSMTGIPFEFSTADAYNYHLSGCNLSDIGLLKMFPVLNQYFDLSDTGRPVTLGIIYSIFGQYVLIPRILSGILSAWMCILLYKFTKRNFGDIPARNTAIICLLLPNFIYYCGLHLKETDMIFLLVLFIERADYALRVEKLNFSVLILPIVAGGLLFFFRTVLAVSAWFAFFSAIVFTSSRLMGWGKRLLIAFWFLLAVVILFSGKIEQEVDVYWQAKDTNQSLNMNFRSKRKDGNTLADKGSAVLFAPVIFIAPFPTLVNIETQQNQMYQNGTYMVKNVMTFFVLIALISILFKYKSYRRHVLLLSFVVSYLAIVAMSAFALSERFHLPAMPFLMVLAGFGITQVTPKQKRFFVPYLVFVAIAVIGWNVFKLAGRGAL